MDECGDEELSEGVVANLTQHRRAATEPRHAHRDITRGATPDLGAKYVSPAAPHTGTRSTTSSPKGDDIVLERSRHGAALFVTRNNGSHDVPCHPAHVRPSEPPSVMRRLPSQGQTWQAAAAIFLLRVDALRGTARYSL